MKTKSKSGLAKRVKAALKPKKSDLNTKTIYVEVSPQLHAQLKHLADAEGVTLSELARAAFEELVR